MHVRKYAIALGGSLALCAIVMLVGELRPVRIAYHKWRLAAAIENLETAGAGRPTAAQQFMSMLWGTLDAGEFLKASHRHEDALLKLRFLSRREFVLSNSPAHKTEPQRVYEEAAKIFPANNLWSVVRSPCTRNAIVVTAPVSDMPEWERLIGRLHYGRMASRKSGFLRVPQRAAAW